MGVAHDEPDPLEQRADPFDGALAFLHRPTFAYNLALVYK
jgi:hypothetical protein